MKKIFAVIAALLMTAAACFTFSACQDDPNVIRVSEVTHSIFYAPLYIADKNGYFTDEGLTVTMTDANGSQNALTAVMTKAADIALSGPETVVYTQNEGKQDAPVIFGQLTACDGSFLMGKTAEPDFSWDNLSGKTVIMGRPGGMPEMTLRYVLTQLGYTHSATPTGAKQVNMFTDINDFATLAATFTQDTAGKYDYCTMFEPTASQQQALGKAFIVASVGEKSGNVPFTAFAATPSYLKKHSKQAQKFLNAVKKGYDFLMEKDTATVAAVLAKSFSFDVTSCGYVVESYKAISAWAKTPVMNEKDFNFMQDIMINAGRLKASERVAHSKAVDNTFANAV